MPRITGKLADFGLVPLAENRPRLIFRASNPAVSGSLLLSTKPVSVVPAYNGLFDFEIQDTESVHPATHYTVQIEWLDTEPTRKTRLETLPWILQVPKAGGTLADLLKVPSNPGAVWTDITPPPNPTPGTWWLDPSTGELKEWS